MDETLQIVRRPEPGGCWDIVAIAPDGAEYVIKKGVLLSVVVAGKLYDQDGKKNPIEKDKPKAVTE